MRWVCCSGSSPASCERDAALPRSHPHWPKVHGGSLRNSERMWDGIPPGSCVLGRSKDVVHVWECVCLLRLFSFWQQQTQETRAWSSLKKNQLWCIFFLHFLDLLLVWFVEVKLLTSLGIPKQENFALEPQHAFWNLKDFLDWAEAVHSDSLQPVNKTPNSLC